MAELTNITSANASLVLVVDTIIPAGVQLEHFSTDQAFSLSEVTVVEDRMGVDGNLAAGWIPSIKTVQIDLEAASPSLWFLDMLQRAMENNRTIIQLHIHASGGSSNTISFANSYHTCSFQHTCCSRDSGCAIRYSSHHTRSIYRSYIIIATAPYNSLLNIGLSGKGC